MISLSLFTNWGGKGSGKRRDLYCNDAKTFVSVHFVRERCNKKFDSFPLKTDEDRDRCAKWYEEHNNPDRFMDIVSLYMHERKIKKEEICKGYGLQSSIFEKESSSKCPVEKWQAIAICFGLDLNLAEARALMKTVGYALSNSSETDLVIRYCFENDVFELADINYILQKMFDLTLNQLPSDL